LDDGCGGGFSVGCDGCGGGFSAGCGGGGGGGGGGGCEAIFNTLGKFPFCLFLKLLKLIVKFGLFRVKFVFHFYFNN
jgi:hypothetical protein